MDGPLLLGLLLLAIVFIIVATAVFKIHPFLVLIVAAYGVGLAAGLSAEETIQALTAGFGGTLGYIGIVIAAGTVIGLLLERSGGASVMAGAVVRWVGAGRTVLAMGLTGALVAIPVFCDSGFIVLSPLNRSLAIRARASLATYAVMLSMGLYATHVFVPPTPGPIAAAGTLGADIGTVMLLGLVVTVPVVFASYLFARFAGRRIYIDPSGVAASAPEEPRAAAVEVAPPVWLAFAPVLVPVALIGLQSVAALPGQPFGTGHAAALMRFAGNPNTALLIGVGLAVWAARHAGPRAYGAWVGDGLREAGIILLITGAGGALGRVLQTTPLGDYLGETLLASSVGAFGLFIPFVVAAALKTALGSSTVAIITTASIVLPVLPSLGLAGELGPALCTLAIGAGSMTVSHANDSYFWVVSQFSGMSVAQAYRLQTVGSAVAGLAGITAVFLLSLLVR